MLLGGVATFPSLKRDSPSRPRHISRDGQLLNAMASTGPVLAIHNTMVHPLGTRRTHSDGGSRLTFLRFGRQARFESLITTSIRHIRRLFTAEHSVTPRGRGFHGMNSNVPSVVFAQRFVMPSLEL